jgi:hypothetical protein
MLARTASTRNMRETWYRQAKETKRGETHFRKSEQPDSTVDVGELYQEESAEGSGLSEYWIAEGKYIKCLEIWKMYQRYSSG